MNTRHYLPAVAITAATLLLTSCAASGGSGDSASSDPIVIGVVEDLSGPSGTLGQNALKGIQLAVDQINSEGGIEALGGRELSLKQYDTATDSSTAVSQSTKAVQDGVAVILGGHVSDTVIAGTNVSSRSNVPWIVTNAGSSHIYDRGLENVFGIAPSNKQAATSFLEAATFVMSTVAPSEPVSMSYVSSQSGFGTDLAASFEASDIYDSVPTDVAFSYPASTTDFTAVAQRLTSAGSPILMNFGLPADGLAIAKVFATTVPTTAVVYEETGDLTQLIEQLGDGANGTISKQAFSTAFTGAPPQLEEVTAAYTEANGGEVLPPDAFNGYISAMLVKAALESAESTDGAALAEALHSVELTHEEGNLFPSETLSFDSDGTHKDADSFFSQVQDGKVVGIYPEEFATTAPIAFR
jgi:branched-chain amino acid transport system substrate-binding protein